MILQALYDYYKRKPDLPKEGFENKEFKFIIVINREGEFVDLIDKREGKKGKEYLVPKAKDRSSSNAWQTTFLLWDHYGYVLGQPKDSDDKSVEMAKKQNGIFVNTIKNLPDEIKNDKGVKAVLLFYEKNQSEEVKKHSNWSDCLKIKGCNLTFQLEGETELIPQREAINNYQQSNLFTTVNEDETDTKSYKSTCLITGERSRIARLHTATQIIGSKSNAKLVSFQKNSGFDSYYKEQSYNAPISISAEAAYSTALKHLLKSTTNKVYIGDSTTIFWAEKKAESFDLEQEFPWYISDSPKDDPDRGVKAVKSLFEAAQAGKLPREEGNRFYVLGLSPNAARIAVRYWRTGTVKDFAEKILMHFEDYKIIHGAKEPEFLCLNKILRAVAFEFKMENVPPNLAGAVITSILDGSQYPLTLLQQCIRRIRAERYVNRARAAILKAYINRFNRINNQNEKEITMALDVTNTNSGYLLGRLFSVIERAQFVANNYKEPNAGIRDRFWGAFSSSTITVLPLLEKLYGHHYKKIKNEKKFFEANRLEDYKKEIIDKLEAEKIPAHLPLEQQALFSIGYYHQKVEIDRSGTAQKESKNENNKN